MWQARKDELNGEAIIRAEESLVEKQVEMWKEHAELARKVRDEAWKYIEERGFDSSSSAIRAIEWAQEEERRTRGVEAFYAAVKDKSSDELLAMVRSMAERQLAEGEIIEATTDTTDKEDAEPSNP